MEDNLQPIDPLADNKQIPVEPVVAQSVTTQTEKPMEAQVSPAVMLETTPIESTMENSGQPSVEPIMETPMMPMAEPNMQAQDQSPMSEFTPVAGPKKSSKLKFYAVLGALLVLAGSVAGYFVFSGSAEEMPPALELNTDQGFIATSKYIEFEAADFERAKDDTTFVNRDYKKPFFYAEKDMSAKEIIESIAADEDLIAQFIHYNTEDKSFYMYPAGYFRGGDGTVELSDSEIKKYTVPAYSPFIIFTNKDFGTWNIKNVDDAPKSTYSPDVDKFGAGWNMVVATKSQLSKMLTDCPNGVTKVYPYQPSTKSGFGTGPVDISDISKKHNTYVAWILKTNAAGECNRPSASSGSDGSGVSSGSSGSSESSDTGSNVSSGTGAATGADVQDSDHSQTTDNTVEIAEIVEKLKSVDLSEPLAKTREEIGNICKLFDDAEALFDELEDPSDDILNSFEKLKLTCHEAGAINDAINNNEGILNSIVSKLDDISIIADAMEAETKFNEALENINIAVNALNRDEYLDTMNNEYFNFRKLLKAAGIAGDVSDPDDSLAVDSDHAYINTNSKINSRLSELITR